MTFKNKTAISVGRKLPVAVAALVLWLAMAGGLWAQAHKKPVAAKPVEQGYLLPYVVTLTAITLGVAAVCFPSQRKNDIYFDEEE